MVEADSDQSMQGIALDIEAGVDIIIIYFAKEAVELLKWK